MAQKFSAPGTHINFLGLFVPVDSINGFRDNFGPLDVALPPGIGHIADAVALSENRYLFDTIDLGWQDTANFTVLGFMGAHSDIGGGYVNDTTSSVTLQWMENQATAAGMIGYKTGPLGAYIPTVHDSYEDSNYGDIRLAPATFPGTLKVFMPTTGTIVNYNSQFANYWNPDLAGDESFYESLPWWFVIA